MSSSLFTKVFDPLAKCFPSLRSPQTKAIIIVVSLLVFSFAMGSIALSSRHKYLPLAVLGIIYGVLLSYPATELLGPKLQSAMGGALGGFSMGNMVHRINHTASSIEYLAQWIAAAIQQMLTALQIGFEAEYLKDGIILCICMAIITMLMIIVINAYLEENNGSTVAATKPLSVKPDQGMTQVAGN